MSHRILAAVVGTAALVGVITPAATAATTTYAPHASVSVGHCADAQTTAATVTLDNRSSSQAVTYRVANVYASAADTTTYVSVAAGTVKRQVVKTTSAKGTVTSRVYSRGVQLAGRAIAPRYCAQAASISYVADEPLAVNVRLVNRTATAVTQTMRVTQDGIGFTEQVRVPAHSAVTRPANTSPAPGTHVVVKYGTRTLADRWMICSAADWPGEL